MSQKINIPPGMQHLTGNQDTIEVNGSTVGECLDQLIEWFPLVKEELFDREGNVLSFIDIYVNGKSSYPEELVKPVKDGDELYILRAIGGG